MTSRPTDNPATADTRAAADELYDAIRTARIGYAPAGDPLVTPRTYAVHHVEVRLLVTPEGARRLAEALRSLPAPDQPQSS